MCFSEDIFRNTKKNAIVSSLFYISSVIDKVCTVFIEKRVKQDKKKKVKQPDDKTSKRYQYNAEDLSIISILMIKCFQEIKNI